MPPSRQTTAGLAAVLVLVAAAALASPTAAPVDSNARPDAVWSTLEMPGAKSGLCRAAGFSDRIETGRLALELIRLLHGESLTGGVLTDPIRGSVLIYLVTIDDFTRASAALRAPELSTAGARRGFRDMRTVAALLGLGFDPKSRAPWHDLPRRQDGVRRMLSDAGLSLDNLAERLNNGEAISLALPRVDLPLPLTERLWRDAIFRGKLPYASLFVSIVRDRTAALVYHGLMSLDEQTLAYFGSAPSLLALARNHPGAIAATVRSVHVHGGRVAVPGGAAAEPLWAALVGASPADEDRFVRGLFSDAGGRLAYFYDAVGHLDSARQRFALGLAAGTSQPDPARFRRLYEALTSMFSSWQIELHPLTRPVGDGVPLLAQLSVDPTARLSPPASAALWRCAFEDGGRPGGEELHGQSIPQEPAADAAALAELVLGSPDRLQRRERVKAVLFAQRVFGGAEPRDAAAVCAVVRGFPRFDALALVLERIGIDDPGTYALAMRRASDLSALDGSWRAPALSQFQGALALIDRLAWQETFDVGQSRQLVASLVAVPLVENGYRGGVGQWLRDRLLPALHARMPRSTATADEDLVIEALAGGAPVVAMPQWPVDWEGQRYVLDPAAAELARLLKVRRKQAGGRVDEPLEMQAIGSALGGAHVPATEEKRLLAQLGALLDAFRGEAAADGDGDAAVEKSVEKAAQAARSFGASPGSDARRLALVDRVAEVADDMLARVLRSLAYAAAIGSPDSKLFLGPDVSLDHDFGLADSVWAVPIEQAGSGVAWHLRGSLLALDVALAPYSLRRVSSDLPLAALRLDPDDERGLAHGALLKRAASFDDMARDRLVALVERGREQASAAFTPSARAALFDDANIDEWRRNVLQWQVGREGARLDAALTLTELFWIGARQAQIAPPDGWGMSMAAVTGCLCLHFGGPATIDTLGIRPSQGVVASLLADATLEAARWTADLRVPAALIPSLLTGLTQDLLDSAQPAHADDWLELAQAARSVSRERFEDHVAALTVAGGPLVPVAGAGTHEARLPDAQAGHRLVAAARRDRVRPGAR